MRNTFINKKFSNDRFLGISFYIVSINILVFILFFFNINIMGLNLRYALALIPKLVIEKHFLWQFLTYFFTHFNSTHLLLNCIQLLFFGLPVERAIGSKEFLLYYLITGFLGGLLTFVLWYFTGGLNYSLIGASGAIFATLIMYAMCYPSSYIFVFFVIPVRSPFFVLVLIVAEVMYMILPNSYSNVAHATHLFSVLAGIIYIYVRMKINFFKEWKNILFYKG